MQQVIFFLCDPLPFESQAEVGITQCLSAVRKCCMVWVRGMRGLSQSFRCGLVKTGSIFPLSFPFVLPFSTPLPVSPPPFLPPFPPSLPFPPLCNLTLCHPVNEGDKREFLLFCRRVAAAVRASYASRIDRLLVRQCMQAAIIHKM